MAKYSRIFTRDSEETMESKPIAWTPEEEEIGRQLQAMGRAEILDENIVIFLMKLSEKFANANQIVDEEMAKIGPVPTNYREAVIMVVAALIDVEYTTAALTRMSLYLRESRSLAQLTARIHVFMLARETVGYWLGDPPKDRNDALTARWNSEIPYVVSRVLPLPEEFEKVEEDYNRLDPLRLRQLQFTLVREGLAAIGA